MKQRLLRSAYIVARPAIYLVIHNSRRSRVLVIHDGSVLLIRSDFGSRHWTLPGGGIKSSETPEVGAQRELHEEVGIEVEEHELKQIAHRVKSFGPLTWPRIHLLFFVVRLSYKPALTLQKLEVSEVQWVPLSEARSMTDIGPMLLDVLRGVDLQ